MKKLLQKIRRLAAVVSVGAMLSSALPIPTMQESLSVNAAGTSTVSNPLIWADVPDEDIIRVGNTYYMVSTTMFFSPVAPIMKSTDLVSWEICNYVYDTMANTDVQNLTNGKSDYAHGQWAASLRYHDGEFYVFFGSYGTGKSYIYKTADIENGTWTRSEINGMYHDASILFDDDGCNYLVYGGGGTIKIKELNAQMTGFQNGGVDKTLLTTGLDGLSGEGSHIQKINGYYYVFLIAWPSGSGRIELCYRSKSLLGSYEAKTVLNSGLGTYGSGVAQGGIVDTPNGDWYAMLFQDHGSVGRIPVLVPVTWQNDWPIMGVNGKAPLTLNVDSGTTGTALAKSDPFSYSQNQLAKEWQWNHNPDNTAWSVTEREGYLRLTNRTLATNLLDARNTLTQRTEGPACESSIVLDTKGMKPGDYAGLSAFQFKYGTVGVYVADDGTKKLYMGENGGYSDSAAVSASKNKIVEETKLGADTVQLKVKFLFNTVNADGSASNNIDKASFYYSYDGSQWTKIGNDLSMTYNLKLFTGYRSGIFSYATKSTGGYADIDSFTYSRSAWNEPTIIEPDENGYYFHSTFESGTDSWSGRGAAVVASSRDAAYAENSSLYVSDRTAAWNGATFALQGAFSAGNAYSFSANVLCTDGAAAQTFYLKLQYTDPDGETQYDTVSSETVIRDSWTQLANTEYRIPDGAANLQLYVETADGKDSFYVDEVIGAVEKTVIPGAGVTQFTLGDVNADGVINALDVAQAKSGVIGGFESTLSSLSADVDRSGTVDADDIKLLCDYVLRRMDTFPLPADE